MISDSRSGHQAGDNEIATYERTARKQNDDDIGRCDPDPKSGSRLPDSLSLTTGN